MKISVGVGALVLAGIVATAATTPHGYSRAQFGTRYTDTDRDGCNTREELLSAPGPCPPRAVEVTITDPYTGQIVHGRQRIQVDHIVALRWAWDHGAAHWTPQRRVEFANDRDNVVLASGSVNQRKGAQGPARWLPPDAGRWCWYAHRWVGVLAEYRVVLASDDPDARALAGALSTC